MPTKTAHKNGHGFAKSSWKEIQSKKKLKEKTKLALIVLGVIVLLTPVVTHPHPTDPLYRGTPRAPFQWIRRWVFGAAMVLMGVASFVGAIGEQLPFFTIYSSTGPLILLGIGAIYFLSAFAKTRRVFSASY